jgi:predicted DsbA family dithiol-disulfide isomerase
VPEGGAPLSDLFPPERLADMQGYVERFAEGFGVLGMRSSGRIQNTRRTLAVVELAREQGRPHEFRVAAMEAYWRQGLDLEQEAVLREVAERAGLDPDLALAVRKDEAYLARVDALRKDAAGRGVSSIPTFFFGDLPPVVGCQPYETLAEAAEAAGATRL